ncbi:GAF domain-containing protein [Cupriavidus campinensis]
MVPGVFSPSCWLPLTPIHSTGGHHTPRIYGLRSYISVPVVLPEGTYFGNLCAIDARPASVSNSRTLAMLESFASLLAAQLATELATRGVHAALLHEREIANLREPIGALQGRTLPLDWDLTCISAMRL